MATLNLANVRKHFAEERATKIGHEKPNDVRETVENTLHKFAAGIYETRKGGVDKKGKARAGFNVSLEQAANAFYGATTDQLLKSLGIYSGSDTLSGTAARLGYDSLNKGSLYKALTEHSSGGVSFGTSQPNNTGGLTEAWRFLIPEVILAAVRTGYTASAQHPNWIASTQNLANMKATMPQILRGATNVSKVNEGANIPLGSVRFGQKHIEVYKVGTGFSLTDELIDQASIDLVALFMQEVGTDMSLGADYAAMQVLINGEQQNGSESAPVIGVDDPSKGFQYRDLKRGFSRLIRLGIPADRIISGEEDSIDITSIDRFQGFQGGTRLSDIKSIVGVPDKFDIDTYPTPSNQIMLLNKSRAMVKLTHRGMLVEDRRNIQNQTNEMFVSDYINFAILKRDARLLIDKSVPFASVGFPKYMDIDARIAAGFLEQ